MARSGGRRIPRQTNKSGVWHEDRQVGTLIRNADGGMRFSYDQGWMENPGSFPVASILNLSQQNWHGEPVIAAFDNLLPDSEGELRAKIAERIGAPGRDVFSLLSMLGRDCVGALQFLPQGNVPGPSAMEYRSISEAEMRHDLSGLAAAPLALGEDDDFRISIAGAQEKTAYLRIGGDWAKPRGITPTSHIFKTPIGFLPGPDEIDLSHSVENELFCMTLAREIGLQVAHVEKLVLSDQVALVVERFDRRWQGNVLRRLPQEDLCQALGLPSSLKYQRHGGPDIRQIMELLRESDQPTEDRETFFRAQIFFYLIGATNGHAKNFSLRLGAQGRFGLAPLYDILSLAPTVHAGRLQRRRYRMAMSVDGQYGIDEIVPRHFEAESQASGLPKGRALELLGDMAAGMEVALHRTFAATEQDDIPASVSGPIFEDAMHRATIALRLLN